ncbi:MAG: small multi-drug export protein [Ruminococcaceae bacterium]|nr:small multi-drug export protein [Oscillospiraceae bacterium]
MDGFITWLRSLLPGEVVAFLVSMLPIIEVRGAIPLAYAWGLSPWLAMPLAFLGNMLPVPFILWFITPIFDALKRTRLFKPLAEKMEQKALGKQDRLAKGYFWGLMLFVGIPLPGTGAWTGALLASLLRIPFKVAFVAITLGVVIATLLMTAFSYGLLDVIIGLF